MRRARETLARLTDDYERAYYAGLICERLAKAALDHRAPGSRFIGLRRAARGDGVVREGGGDPPGGDDDAILRWNTCARLLNQSPHIAPRGERCAEPVIGE